MSAYKVINVSQSGVTAVMFSSDVNDVFIFETLTEKEIGIVYSSVRVIV